MSAYTTNKIALSFDVEDWFTVRNMREHFDFSTWDEQELRVDVGMKFILDELRNRNIKATFFILGWVAERCPELVTQIMNDGHVIASHGYSHTPIDLLTPETFEIDLKKSLDVLTGITGKKIKGFRAPSFSITTDTYWALDILKRNGIEYDSSIFSKITHPDYGIKDFPTTLTDVNGILEVPMCKGKFFGLNIPANGGGYFRLLPYSIIKTSLKQSLRKDPLVMYFHPWEFDVDQPRVELSKFKKFRHYVGLNSNREKFIKLLNDFEFMTIEELIETQRKGTFAISELSVVS